MRKNYKLYSSQQNSQGTTINCRRQLKNLRNSMELKFLYFAGTEYLPTVFIKAVLVEKNLALFPIVEKK